MKKMNGIKFRLLTAVLITVNIFVLYSGIKAQTLYDARDGNLNPELRTNLQNSLTRSPGMQRGTGIDFSKTTNIPVENHKFHMVENSLKEDRDQKNSRNKYRALGGGILLGYGKLTGNISNYFTDPVFIGINVDIHRQRLVIQIDDYIGFGQVKKTMAFPDGQKWFKNKPAFHLMLGGSLGYTLMNSNSIKIVPLGGVGVNLLSSTLLETSDNQENRAFLPYYKIGFYFDIKSFRLFPNNSGFNYDEDYTCVRLSFGLKMPVGKPKFHAFYHGSMFYFMIGMGGLGKK